MWQSSASYLLYFALAVSATEGIIGYNALFGRDACLQITTGADETVADPSTHLIGTSTSSANSLSTAPAPAPASPTPAPPASPTPPFATGMCSLHMTQWDSLANAVGNNGENNGDYGCEVRILDNNRQTIGWQVHTDCSTAHPLSIESKLENPFVITPEARGDYVQFTVGSVSWPSSQGGPQEPNCNVGGWDGSDDPAVSAPLEIEHVEADPPSSVSSNGLFFPLHVGRRALFGRFLLEHGLIL